MMKWIMVWALLAAGAPGPPPALQQFNDLQQQARKARESGNNHERIRALGALAELLNDSPQIVESQAAAYAAANDPDHALDALDRFVAMGQSDPDIATSEVFAKLRDLPRFRAITAKMSANNTPVEKAQTALALTDSALLAEDIDFDESSRSFLLTSVLEKKILRVSETGKTTEFAASPSDWPMLAIKIDPIRKRVWATEVALKGEGFAPERAWGTSAVLCFDLESGKLLQRIEAPHTALGDMALDPRGNPIVSDGEGGGIYEIAQGKLRLLNNHDFISPQTPVLVPGSTKLFVPDYARGIAGLDLNDGRVTWLKGSRFALAGIDGLYFKDGALFATQNGSSPERVVRFQLDASLTEVTSEQVIERETATLGDPTHGVIEKGVFYYIANSGWSYVDEQGRPKPGVKREPPRIMRVALTGIN